MQLIRVCIWSTAASVPVWNLTSRENATLDLTKSNHNSEHILHSVFVPALRPCRTPRCCFKTAVNDPNKSTRSTKDSPGQMEISMVASRNLAASFFYRCRRSSVPGCFNALKLKTASVKSLSNHADSKNRR